MPCLVAVKGKGVVIVYETIALGVFTCPLPLNVKGRLVCMVFRALALSVKKQGVRTGSVC